MFCCVFLTNILQNRRKRISATLLDDGTRHGHTLSQPAHIVGQPSALQPEGGGGGVGDPLESPVETHSMFVVFFFLHVLLLFFTV